MRKTNIIWVLGLILFSLEAAGQVKHKVSGVVVDNKEHPLTGASVYIKNTIDGGIADSTGHFEFFTTAEGMVSLRSTYLGFKEYTLYNKVDSLSSLHIMMKEDGLSLSNVEVVASNFNFGSYGKLKKLDAYDVVMTGSSCGDIFAALGSLPGVQKVGENGRLYVRGGDNFESQVFINGMHVLNPYDEEPSNTVTRSRFSPFLFKGINFSLGGYAGEYGQALSSILPMETTDVSSCDKLGVNISPLSAAVGGTKAFTTSSLSFNTEFMNLGLYNKMFPDRYDWKKPYQKITTEMQWKKEFTPFIIFKSYASYNNTSLKYGVETDDFDPNERDLKMTEDNVYANGAFYVQLPKRWSLFSGIANSFVKENIYGVLVSGDHYVNFKNEVHVKTYATKAIGSRVNFKFGAENYIRNYWKKSIIDSVSKLSMNYQSYAIFADGQYKLSKSLFSNLSLRMENNVANQHPYLMPRVTFSYIPNKEFQVSALFGRYSQVIGDDYDVYGPYRKCQSYANHAILSLQYQNEKTVLRMEGYYKRYSHLLTYDANGLEGKGRSKGFDFFLEDQSLVPNLTTTLAYSFNDSKRKYLQYNDYVQPQYVSKHNFHVTLKYFFAPIKAIVSVSNDFASGRPYTNPQKEGWMNATTKPYNSFGLNMTFLLSPSVILYASATNLFNRHNIFNYQYRSMGDGSGAFARKAVQASRDRFFYITLFISLKKTHAYEISNF